MHAQAAGPCGTQRPAPEGTGSPDGQAPGRPANVHRWTEVRDAVYGIRVKAHRHLVPRPVACIYAYSPQTARWVPGG